MTRQFIHDPAARQPRRRAIDAVVDQFLDRAAMLRAVRFGIGPPQYSISDIGVQMRFDVCEYFPAPLTCNEKGKTFTHRS